jgi:hypothetical protein
MACCIVGSLLIVSTVWCVRVFKEKVLGQPPSRPEEWRLDLLPAGSDAIPGSDASPVSRELAGAVK